MSQTAPPLPGASFGFHSCPYLTAVSQGAFPLGNENTVIPLGCNGHSGGEEGHEHNRERERGRDEDMKSKKRTEGTVEKQNCELHHGERKRQENKDQVKDLKRTKHNWNTLVCSFSYSTWEGRQKKKKNTFTVTPKDTAGIFLYSMAHWCLPCDIYCTMFYVQVEKDGLWLH